MSMQAEISPQEATQSALVAYLDELLHGSYEAVRAVSPAARVSDVVQPPQPAPAVAPPPPRAAADLAVPRSVDELYAQASLACIFVRSDAQVYALALSQLGRIFRADERPLTRLPGQADWQLGLLAGEELLQAISLHYLLHGCLGQQPRYFISVAGTSRVLACEAILHSAQLHHEDFQWRASGVRKHPLLAATLRSELVPLLDLTRLDECLH